ncbi:MAG: PAS domain S-box protein [Rhodocyclaceae bacterium]|nr:MAG: PAS domain S-box protein [Rhodocyclaceae bacterium]
MNPRLVLSVLLPFAACGLQWLLWDYIKPYAWILFFPTAFFCAWLGGLRGGLIGTTLSALLAWYFFIPPTASLVAENPAGILSITVFLIMGYLFAFFAERLREAQERTETRFEATFEQAAVGIALLDPDGRWLRVNRKLCDIVGYRPDELLSKSFQDITHPDDLSSDLEFVGQVLAGEINTYTLEKRYLRKDGSIVWINLSVSLARQPDGSPDYFISVVEDISARKEAEANLTEAKRLAKLGHWHWDLQADRHVWSEEIYRIYGRDPALPPAVYPEVQSYFTPKTWSGLVAAVENCRANGQPYACDAEVVVADGTNRWITARGEAVRNAENKIIALRGTVQDITERKLAEQVLADTQAAMLEQQKQARIATLNQMQDANAARAKAEAALAALHESREQLKLFIEHAPASLAMLDREMRYLAVSRRWLTEYSIGDRNVLGHSHYEIFPEIGEDWKSIHRRSLGGEVIRADHDRFERADGSVQWIRWEVRPWMAANGAIGGIVIFSEDITRQKLAEEEIHRLNTDLERRVVERTAELSAANRELDSFAYAVSRDLRAPLRAMSGFSQALIEDYGEQLADDAKKYLDQIGIASRRMSDLIDGILALSRSTRGDLQRDRIDISALASQRLATLALEAPSRRVGIQVEPGLTVEGDARMIEAVIDNLIDNAWKYTGKASAPEIRVYGENRDGAPWICVADNGAGFDMAHTERLFKPFQRLHRQDEFPGIGIGLATVQRIIHRHGGEIAACGEPNRGATFCFKLPAAASLHESE